MYAYRPQVIENDRKVISKVVSRWGDSISPFTPYGAVVVTIPVKAVEEGTTVTVEEMEPRPLPNTAAPPKPGTQVTATHAHHCRCRLACLGLEVPIATHRVDIHECFGNTGEALPVATCHSAQRATPA